MSSFPFPSLFWELLEPILHVALGVLSVTRALGDSSMKEFVIGSPYTTRTELGADCPYLILACDGVIFFFFLEFMTGALTGTIENQENDTPTHIGREMTK